MIYHYFGFLPGIGDKMQKKLHLSGVRRWDDFLIARTIKGMSSKRKAWYDRQLRGAKSALQQQNAIYFSQKVAARDVWRLYYHFKDSCVFLDVEVDSSGGITVVTLCNKFESKTLVRGMHLSKENVQQMLDKHKLLVSYNGRAFDVPKLETQLGMNIEMPHIDLKGVCQQLGLVGGLKEIEKKLGIDRPSHLQGHPVDLWKAYWASGDREWLDLLVQYNEEDTVNLVRLMEKCVKMLHQEMSRS